MNIDFYNKYLSAKKVVLQVLKSNLKSRDDDNVLFIEVWKIQSEKEILLYSSFKEMLLTGILSTPETISRSRRKIQESTISLRGKLYDARHKQEQLMRLQMSFDF